MSKRASIVLLVLVVLLTGLGTWYIMSPSPQPAANKSNPVIPNVETGAVVGKALPSITLSDLAGKSVQVNGKGKITVVNFWATWCPPCRQEMPDLNRFAAKHQNDVAFYAINIQESAGKVSDFMAQNNYTRMEVLLDKDGAVAKRFQVSGIPTTIVVDKNGVIRFRKAGGMTMSELEGIINGL